MASAAALPHMPEILRLICEQLIDDTHTLTVLARTSKDFEEPALNVLWSELTGFYPLAKILPPNTWKEEILSDLDDGGQVMLRQHIDAKECTRFLRYCRRVRSFIFFAYDDSMEWVDITVFQGLLIAMGDKKLLPNLQKLSWNCTDYFDYFPFIHMFLGPYLTSVDVTLARDLSPLQISMVPLLRERYPSLEHLAIKQYPLILPASEIKQVLLPSDCINSWQNLRTLEVPELTSSALIEVAQIPTLRCLKLTDCTLDIQVPDVPMEGGFPALRELLIHSTTAKNYMTFLKHMNLTQARTVELKSRCIETRESWKSLFETVSQCFNHKELQCLTCADGRVDVITSQPPGGGGEVIDYEDIKPLLSFENISRLELRVSRGYNFSLTSIMPKEMAIGWKTATSLIFESAGTGTTTGSFMLTDLLHFAEHCPNLSELRLPLDATSPPKIPVQKIKNRIFQTKLTVLGVGDSPVKKPFLVAAFLSRTFPSLRLVHSEVSSRRRGLVDEEWRAISEHAKAWGQVSESVKVFSDVRAEEKLYLEDCN